MKNGFLGVILVAITAVAFSACSGKGGGTNLVTPTNGAVAIPVSQINDGSAHFFKVKADTGIMVTFFTLKSADGIIRAAVDSCDVCFKAGKGYYQQGDFMVCENCGQKFASARINEVKGGCNPAPLVRSVSNNTLYITMNEINKNSWYSQYKQQS